jgi:ParB family chromosome partitioning protein
LAKELGDSRVEIEDLSRVALDVRAKAAVNDQSDEDPQVDPSVAAFEAVSRHVKKSVSSTLGKKPRSKTTALVIDGTPVGAIKRSGRALRLDLTDVDDAFAEWLDARAQDVLEELHDRWKGET